MNVNPPQTNNTLSLPTRKARRPHHHGFHMYARDVDHPRLPFAQRMSDTVRGHFVAISGEFVGTVFFLWMALGGTQVANNIPSSSGLTVAQTGSNPQQLQYIALCFGFALAVNAWVFFRISGGLFNPAVTIGMCLIGALPWVRGALLFITQIVAGMVAAALVGVMFPGPLTVTTSLGGGTTVAQGVFVEMFLTAQLVFTIFMLAAEKHQANFIAPVGIGLSLFIAELVGVYFTGGSLNPARTFGPAVVIRSFETYHWIYWVGPILGSFLAAAFYKFIKALEYETVNPEHQKAAEKQSFERLRPGTGDTTHKDFADGGFAPTPAPPQAAHTTVGSPLEAEKSTDSYLDSTGAVRRPNGRGSSYMA